MTKSLEDQKKKPISEDSQIPGKENTLKALEQAEHDMEKDPDIGIEPGKGDDLDEGELARLEGEK